MLNVLLAHLANLRNLSSKFRNYYPSHSNCSSHTVGICHPHASMCSRLLDMLSLLQHNVPTCPSHTVLIRYTNLESSLGISVLVTPVS